MNSEPGGESMENGRPFHIKMKLTLYFLQVFDLQSVHVQAYHITRGSETVIGLNEVAELGLGEELLLCQRQKYKYPS